MTDRPPVHNKKKTPFHPQAIEFHHPFPQNVRLFKTDPVAEKNSSEREA
jgi:hypothetical protein